MPRAEPVRKMWPGISAASNSLFSKLQLFCSDCETLYHKRSLSVAGISESAPLHELAGMASAHSAPSIFSLPSPGRRLRPHLLHGLHTSSLTRAHKNQRRWMRAQPSAPSWGSAPLSTQANPPAWCPQPGPHGRYVQEGPYRRPCQRPLGRAESARSASGDRAEGT